jgi:hypothetical protein
MGYRIRVLSTSSECIALDVLQSAIAKNKLKATITVEVGEADDWTRIGLGHADGQVIALIERDLVAEDSVAAAELDEFADEITTCKPANAAAWLNDYFNRVRCIYVFQLLNGTDHKNGWEILGALKDSIWSFAPSIIQADLEGFSNEEGYHILWQFNDSAKGDWWMGILQDGQWRHFQMDLGNPTHRQSFFDGQIPAGAKLP